MEFITETPWHARNTVWVAAILPSVILAIKLHLNNLYLELLFFLLLYIIIILFIFVCSFTSSLPPKPWLALGREHKTSPVASFLREITPVVHPKCRQVAMHLVPPLDAYTLLLPLSTMDGRLQRSCGTSTKEQYSCMLQVLSHLGSSWSMFLRCIRGRQ